MADGLLIGKGTGEGILLPEMAVRHGVISGATGSGKTITLKVLCESFSAIGTPVFVVDAKGDVSSLAVPGTINDKIQERLDALQLAPFDMTGYPVELWDVYGEKGHPMRSTVLEMGPVLMARLLELNDTQAGILHIVYKYADDQGLALIDLKDLRALLNYAQDNSDALTADYGKVQSNSIGAILRKLLVLEEQGGSIFFGEPAIELTDLMLQKEDKGVINVLAAERLMRTPALYATVLLWLLSELFESLPEMGEVAQPKLVLFFDEAHMIFKDAPKVLLEQIEQVVRLIRSKGVGVYFISQSPMDIPDTVLAQLGNRIQHVLRAYTPKEQKAVKTVSETFRQNPAIDTASVIGTLSTGEALVSFLDAKGVPGMVEQVTICPPHSRIGVLSEIELAGVRATSLIGSKYDQQIDSESAYEILTRRIEADETAKQEAEAQALAEKEAEVQAKAAAKEQAALEKEARRQAKEKSFAEDQFSKATGAMLGTLSRTIGREIARGILGSIKKR